ncbi:MAG: IS630 family transposase [Terriglobia bacterium]
MSVCPIELRERIVRAVDLLDGKVRLVGELFAVSESLIYKLLRQQEASGSLAPKPHRRGFAPMLAGAKLEQLRRLVQEQPDATLQELQQRLQERAQVRPSLPTVCRALQKLGLGRKKKKFFAQERDPKQRQRFLRKAGALDPEKMVFIDEMGANINLSRTYARAPAGQRIEEALPQNTPARLSTVGALGANHLLSCCCMEGAFDGEAFAVFIETMVAPRLKPGDTVLMDNVPIHQCPRVKSAIESAGAQLLPLPTYSPDLDPIESCWSKIKTHLRNAKARTVDRLYSAIAAGIKLVTPGDIHGWFNECGYSFMGG